MKKLTKFSTLITTAMLLVSFMAVFQTVQALPGPWITIEPSPVHYNNGAPSTVFNVSVYINNVTLTDSGLDGWQIEMHYDDSIINVTSDVNGVRAWPSATRLANKYDTDYVFYSATSVGSSLATPAYGHVGPGEGYCLVGDAIIIGAPWKGAKGLMAVIEFEILVDPPKLGWANSTLDITNAFSWIKQGGVTDTRAVFIDGKFENEWVYPDSPYMGLVLPNTDPDPAPLVLQYGPYPPAAIGQFFDAKFYINDLYSAWALTSAQFTVTYDSTILEIKGGTANVTVDPFWGANWMAYVAGTITINVTNPSSTPGGNPADVLVATITFTVIKQQNVPPAAPGTVDTSPITIGSVSLYDHIGAIPFTAADSGTVNVYALLTLPMALFEVQDPFDGDNLFDYGPDPVVGDQFDVDVVIGGPGIEGLHYAWYLIGFQFRLFYDDTLLAPVSITEGPFLPAFATHGTFFIGSWEANGLGPHALVGDIMLPNTTGDYDMTSWPNGTGVIATIRFEIINQGESICNWTEDSYLSCELALGSVFGEWAVNRDGEYIPIDEASNVDGLVIVYDTARTGRMIDLYGGAENGGYGTIPFPTPYGGQGQDHWMDLVFPQSEVTLFAYVTYNCWPVQQKDVGFELEGPFVKLPNGTLVPGQFTKIWAKFTVRTNSDGYAILTFRMPWPCDDPESITGVWIITATVSIADVVVDDTLPFYYEHLVNWVKVTTDKYYYNHEEYVEVTVCYGTHSVQMYPAIFAIVLTDELGVPFAMELVDKTIGGAVWCTLKEDCFTVQLYIPKFAYSGYAYVHVSVYDKDPTDGGFAYTYEYEPYPEIYIRPA